jgi:hypothetical protein
LLPAQLQEVIAQAIGIPAATVLLYGRALRENGFIATGGRGRSAKSATTGDAATILLGMMGSTTAAGVTQIMADFKKMRLRKDQSDGLILAPVLELRSASSAIDAMTCLLDSLVDGELVRLAAKQGVDELTLTRGLAVRYRQSGGRPRLALSLPKGSQGKDEFAFYEQLVVVDNPGFEVVVKVSGQQLMAIATAFRPGSET